MTLGPNATYVSTTCTSNGWRVTHNLYDPKTSTTAVHKVFLTPSYVDKKQTEDIAKKIAEKIGCLFVADGLITITQANQPNGYAWSITRLTPCGEALSNTPIYQSADSIADPNVDFYLFKCIKEAKQLAKTLNIPFAPTGIIARDALLETLNPNLRS